MKHHFDRRYIPLIVLVLLSLIIWTTGLYKQLNFETLKVHEAFLNTYIQKHFLAAIFIYMATYILVVSLSIPGALFMTLTGGFLFGQSLGTVLVVISATVGSCILYYVIRLSVADSLFQNPGPKIEKIKQELKGNEFFYLMTLRLLPIFPFALINLACALMRIPFQKFFFATLIGIIPGSWLYASVGTGIHALFEKNLQVSTHGLLSPMNLGVLIGLGLFSLSPIIYKKLKKL